MGPPGRVEFGAEFFSGPPFQASLDQARDTDRAVMTGKVDLNPNQKGSFLIYLPVYQSGVPVREESARRAGLAGFIFAVVDANELWTGIFPRKNQAIDFEVFDGDNVNREHLLYDADEVLHVGQPAFNPHFKKSVSLPFLNRTWKLYFSSLPPFESAPDNYLPWLVLVAGLVVSTLLFGITAVETKNLVAAKKMNAEIRAANEDLTTKIAEKERADAALAYERDLLRSLLDNLPDRVYFKDRQSRFLICSREVLKNLGLQDLDEAIGKTDADFFTKEYAQRALEDERRIIETGQPMIGIIEKEIWHNGQESWVLTTKMPLRDKEGNIIGTHGISKDITALKKSEEALANEKERLAVTLRSIGDGVIATNTDGTIILFNAVAEQLTGWSQSEVLGKTLGEVFHLINEKTGQPMEDPIGKVVATGKVVEMNHHALLLSRDQLERIIAHNAAPIHDKDGKIIGVVLVFRDMTEQSRIEEELLKANKLESIGLLAGGIAHDFNNILTSIIGNLSLAKMSAHSIEKVLARIADAEKAAGRARELTAQLLTFAKGGEPIKRPLQLPALLKGITQLALRGADVQCEFSLPADLAPVEADEGQITQAINNLVINAREAMNGVGKLELKAENVELTESFLPPLPAGEYVKISIRDYGVGISPAHISKIFDPYFTTKEQGIGMGLAMAYSVVRKHDGMIKVESALGAGSVFYLYLPASAQPLPVEIASPMQPDLLGQGRILVMDDEADIRMVASMMLELLGYEVELVRDGAEAIDRYLRARAEGRPFQAIIMDLSIPNGMGGKETIQRLRELDPKVKAIVSSGYSYDPVMANHREYGFLGVVPKPYKVEDLGQALQQILKE